MNSKNKQKKIFFLLKFMVLLFKILDRISLFFFRKPLILPTLTAWNNPHKKNCYAYDYPKLYSQRERNR